MNRIRKYGYGLVLALVLLFGSVIGVQAEGTTSIAVSKSAMELGDKVMVTVQGSESATMNIKYNASVLTLADCNAQGYTTSGNVVTLTATTAKLTFTAAGEGKSSIIVSSDTLSGSSTAVNVAVAATEDTSDTTNTTNNSDATGSFTIDAESYVVSDRYSSGEIPAGLSKTDVVIEDSTYTELSNGTMTLVYLKPASNTSGSGTFYIYNEADNSVTPMVLIGTQEQYVITMTPSEMFLDTLAEATCVVNDVEVKMYQISGEDNEFYYVYGMDEGANEGWFQYDALDETIQRVNTDMISSLASATADSGSAVTTTDDSTSKLTKLRLAIAALIFFLVVCIIVIFNMKLNHTGEDLDEDEEEEEIRPTIRRGARTTAQEDEDALFYAKDDERTKALFMDLDKDEDELDSEDEDEIAAITIEDITGASNQEELSADAMDLNTDMEEENEEEEEEERLSRRERKRRRKLEEDIFADYQAPVLKTKSEKKTGNHAEDEDSKIEILDLNDL